MTDLQQYVDTWWVSIGDLLDLASSLDAAEWDLPTDLPGWDVRAVLAHTAHLEGVLGGGPHEPDPFADGSVPVPEHVTGLMGQFTEIGVLNRRETDPAEIIEEIRRYSAVRHDDLLADPPTDPDALAPGIFGAIGWSTGTLLRNRPLDVWMHEQDVRRAVGRPGHLDTPGARHCVDYLSQSLGYVLAKRVKAEAGTTLATHVEGHEPIAATVGADGRGLLLPEVPDDPSVTLRMDRETFLLLAGGRRPAAVGDVAVEGDQELAARILAALAVTP